MPAAAKPRRIRQTLRALNIFQETVADQTGSANQPLEAQGAANGPAAGGPAGRSITMGKRSSAELHSRLPPPPPAERSLPDGERRAGSSGQGGSLQPAVGGAAAGSPRRSTDLGPVFSGRGSAALADCVPAGEEDPEWISRLWACDDSADMLFGNMLLGDDELLFSSWGAPWSTLDLEPPRGATGAEGSGFPPR